MKNYLRPFNRFLTPLALAVLVLAVALAAPSAWAAAWTSTSAGGSWTSASTWTVNSGTPAVGDTVTIATTGGNSVTLSANTTIAGVTIIAGAVLDESGYTLINNGNFSNSGLFKNGASSQPLLVFAVSNAVYNFTPGVGQIGAAVIGGGGSGAGVGTLASGGGGGGCAYSSSFAVNPITTYTVVVGGGGVGASGTTNGTGGGASSLSGGSITTLSGNGGAVGNRSNSGGSGGTASGGTTYSGGAGGSGSQNNYGGGGGGAGGTGGTGNAGSTYTAGGGGIAGSGNIAIKGGDGGNGADAVNAGGNPGSFPGGGGGGATKITLGTANKYGGKGASGAVYILFAVPPTVSTPSQASLGTTTATLGATLNANNGYNVTDYGVVWADAATTTTPTTSNNKVQVGTTDPTYPNSYTKSVTGLPVNTQIYYGGYAVNVAGTAYSSYDSFWTLANTPSAPTLGTPAPTSIPVSITSGDGNPATTTYAIFETSTAQYVQANGSLGGSAVYQTASAWGTVTVIGLTVGTTYTFEVEAQNGASVATGFGSTTSATTTGSATAPVVTTTAASAVTATTATLNGSVIDGGAALTDYGFYWSTTSPVTTGSTKTQVGTVDFNGNYTAGLTGLSVNAQYFYRAYAVNSAGATLGAADVSFWTLANTPVAPTVATPGSNLFTTLNVTIGSGDGNPSTTTYAIFETSTSQYVQANGSLGGSAVYQTASAWGTVTVTGLTAGQTYNFEVEAQNGASVATSYGPPASLATSSLTDYQFQSQASGNWNDYNTWSVSVAGGALRPAVAGEVPQSSGPTNITIVSPNVVTVTASSPAVNLTVANGATLTVSGGVLTVNHSASGPTDLDVHGTLNLSYASGNALTFGTGGLMTLESDGVLNHSGAIAQVSGGTLTFNGSYYQNIDGGTVPTATWAATSTCEIDGITSTTPTGFGQTFGNLTWNCAGQSANVSVTNSATVAGNVHVESTGGTTNQSISFANAITIGGNLQIDASSAFGGNPSSAALTVTGTNTVDGYFNLPVVGGVKTFSNTFTVNSGGYVIITGNYAQGKVNFNGDFVVNSGGSFVHKNFGANPVFNGNVSITGAASLGFGSSVVYFNGTGKTISGSFTIGTTNSIGGTYTNNATLTVSGPLTDTGTLTQGTNSTLNLGADPNTIATFDATAAGNTVNYSANATQTIIGTTYNNLTLSGTSTKTLGASTTVNGTLTLGGNNTAALALGGFTLTYGASSTLKYAATTAQTTSTANEFPSTGVVNLEITNTSNAGVKLDAGKTITGTLTVDAGELLDFNGQTLTNGGTSLGGALKMEVAQSGPSSELTQSSGTLNYAGALTVTTSDQLANGSTYTLFSSSSLSGWFSSVTLPALAAGLTWDTNHLATTGVLDVYTFTTTPLAFWTPTNTAATIAAAKLANHVSNGRLSAYPAPGWSATATTPANGGSVVVNGDGNLTYTPAGAANVSGGTDSFTVTFYDGNSSQTMAVTVTVGTSSSGGQSPNVVNSGTDVSGNFYALFAGLPNTPYTVETNSLVSGGTWVKYADYTSGNDGLINVTNVPPVGGSLYFRTVYPSY